MAHTDGRDIGRLLDALVPPLPAPPDRLAGIVRRARRQRRWIGVLAMAGMVAALLGASALLPDVRPGQVQPPSTGPAGPGRGDCPATLPSFPATNGSLPATGPGVLAPGGAVRAIMCAYPVDGSGDARELVLTRDVAGLVAELNKLPSEEQLDPCMTGGGGGYLTLVYGDGTRHTIDFAGVCGFVRRGAITRHNGFLAVQGFDRRYREQEIAAADPDAVTPADCGKRLTADEAEHRFLPAQVVEAWLHTYGDDHRYLAGPAAVVTACRYERRGGGEYWRTGKVSDRSVAGRTDTAVQDAFQTLPTLLPYFDCGPLRAVKTIDVLVIRDSVGETAEVRLPRDACRIVAFTERDGRQPNENLTTLLDELLGPVP